MIINRSSYFTQNKKLKYLKNGRRPQTSLPFYVGYKIMCRKSMFADRLNRSTDGRMAHLVRAVNCCTTVVVPDHRVVVATNADDFGVSCGVRGTIVARCPTTSDGPSVSDRDRRTSVCNGVRCRTLARRARTHAANAGVIASGGRRCRRHAR